MLKISRPVWMGGAFLAISAVALWWRLAVWPYETTENSYLKAHMTQISPRESGYVREVLFVDNQHVETGDLLVVIDDADYRARVDEAEAQYKVEQAGIETLQKDRLVQKARLKEVFADISAANADLERTSKDLRRFKNLVGEGAVSPQNRDAAEAGFRQAGALQEKSVAAQEEASVQLESIDARIAQSRARLEVLGASLNLAKIALSHTRITAPISGTIGNLGVQVGQLVKPGNVLGFLIPDKDVFVEANFKETQIEFMKKGQPVEIQVDALSSETLSGVVDSFSPASGSEFSLLPPENATGNFTKIVRRVPVKIVFDSAVPGDLLRPGLSTTVKVKVH